MSVQIHVDNLLATTLALEAALQNNEIDQAPSLLARRELLLDAIEAAPFDSSWAPVLEAVRRIDDRLAGKLSDIRSEATSQLMRQSNAKRQLQSYRPQSAVVSAIDQSE